MSGSAACATCSCGACRSRRSRGVLLTHFHSDHIPELGEIRLQTWVAGRRRICRSTVRRASGRVVAGFEEAYALDTQVPHRPSRRRFPAARGGADGRACPCRSREDATTAVVLDDDGLKITAIRVHHDPAKPAYGYRFDYKGRSVVISGDTAPDEDLAQAAKGADMLVHEGLQPEMVGGAGRRAEDSGQMARGQDHARHPRLPFEPGGGGAHRQRGGRQAPRLHAHAAAPAQCGGAAHVPERRRSGAAGRRRARP